MQKNIITLILGAALLAGCGKSQKEAAAERAAEVKAKAVAKAAAKKPAGPTREEKKQAAKELISLICSSPRLLDEAETSIDLLEAFSGEGVDKNESNKHFVKAKNYYGALLEVELPARGSSYQTLMLYAGTVIPRQADGDRKEFHDMLRTHCRGVDEARADRVIRGILFYCAAPVPR